MSLIVNKQCMINQGILEGFVGNIVSYNYLEDEVIIRIDNVTLVVVSSKLVTQ